MFNDGKEKNISRGEVIDLLGENCRLYQILIVVNICRVNCLNQRIERVEGGKKKKVKFFGKIDEFMVGGKFSVGGFRVDGGCGDVQGESCRRVSRSGGKLLFVLNKIRDFFRFFWVFCSYFILKLC